MHYVTNEGVLNRVAELDEEIPGCCNITFWTPPPPTRSGR